LLGFDNPAAPYSNQSQRELGAVEEANRKECNLEIKESVDIV